MPAAPAKLSFHVTARRHEASLSAEAGIILRKDCIFQIDDEGEMHAFIIYGQPKRLGNSTRDSDFGIWHMVSESSRYLEATERVLLSQNYLVLDSNQN